MKIFVYVLLAAVLAAFARSENLVKFATPRDSAQALLDTSRNCIQMFGADTSKWDDCVDLMFGSVNFSYMEYKKGRCTREWYFDKAKNNQLNAFITSEKKKFDKVFLYNDNGFIERVMYNNYKTAVFYGGRKQPFTGTDSVYEDGKLRSVSNYKMGKENGNQYRFHSNGNIEAKGYYVNGRPEKKHRFYYPDGGIFVVSDHKKGMLTDEFVYFRNGRLKYESHFKNGLMDGVKKEYYENGSRMKTTTYRNGKKNGKMVEYSMKTGKVIGSAIFKNDKLVGKKKCADGRTGAEEMDCHSVGTAG